MERRKTAKEERRQRREEEELREVGRRNEQEQKNFETIMGAMAAAALNGDRARSGATRPTRGARRPWGWTRRDRRDEPACDLERDRSGQGLSSEREYEPDMTELPRVPQYLVGGLAALPELFLASARWRGRERSDVEQLISIVPDPLRTLPCFLDRLTSMWRYDYGNPFVDLPGGGTVFGTNMYHEVDRLFDVLDCARRRLSASQLANYIQRMADPNKHEDILVEFMPILRLAASVSVDYEVVGYGEGNKTVDWVLRSEGVHVALDVKNRTKDLLESFALLQATEHTTGDRAPAPMHDPAILFKGVESKFKERRPDDVIQAVWISTALKQEVSELAAAFAKLDAGRVHAAILGDWGDDVYIWANDPAARERLVRVLGVRSSDRFVFRRGDGEQGVVEDGASRRR
jgi:hypothetical protein